MVRSKIIPRGSARARSPRGSASGWPKRRSRRWRSGQIVDLDRPLENGDAAPIEMRILTPKDREALDVLRHSTAHIMARAIMRIFPGVRLAFGPTTATGFYYDVEVPGRSLSEDDFPAIEAEMARILKDAEPFERFTLPVAEARQFVADLGQTLKVEHIDDELHKYGVLSFYRQGEFVDLCRGPHIPHAGKVGAFKLLSIAGAYWKGQTDRQMLQRVYGTAFFDKKDLDAHIAQVEEAKKRDHRRLGRELNLFTISPLVGPGLILWMPKGAVVRGILEIVHQGRARQARLPAGLHAAYRQDRALPDQRPLSLLQGLAVSDPQDAVDAAAKELLDGLIIGKSRRRRPARPAGQGRHPRAHARAEGPTTEANRHRLHQVLFRDEHRPSGSATSSRPATSRNICSSR